MTKSRNINNPKFRWTPARDEQLRALYPDNTATVVAEIIGARPQQIYSRAHRLGIEKSPEFFASDRSGRVSRGKQHPSIVATQFKPGLQPWNKGTHFAAGGRSAETRFKPGDKPHTTMPLGSYRLVTEKDGTKHLERKTSEAAGANHMRWTPVSRLVWEAAHGPTPAGCLVVFKPGMRSAVLEEITVDRLECITRAEHAARNHPNRSNPEIAKLIQLKGAITRQVNRIQRESTNV